MPVEPPKRTIKEAQRLLDHRKIKRQKPKRHATGKRIALRAQKKARVASHKAATNLRALRRYKARIAAYFRGEAETRPSR